MKGFTLIESLMVLFIVLFFYYCLR
ncbi:prepilin-type N-terminal cleavage/methylation domain-containing protein [Candidatus Enterococcus mansonii]|nr:prepilin-type N-terminal cleavage/methylation domain-containing protein [Enterococcus sp. 4G2_DIV0659]